MILNIAQSDCRYAFGNLHVLAAIAHGICDSIGMTETFLIEFVFFIGVQAIRSQLEIYVREFASFFAKVCVRDVSDQNVQSFSQRFEAIFERAGNLNDLFSIQLLMSMLVSFLEITTTLYLVVKANREYLPPVWRALYVWWLFIYALKMLALLTFCKSTSQSVSSIPFQNHRGKPSSSLNYAY